MSPLQLMGAQAAGRDRNKCFYFDEKTGRFCARMWRRDILPKKLALATPAGAYPFTITAATGIQPAFVFVQPLTSAQGQSGDVGSPFLWQAGIFNDSTDGTASANWTVQFKDNGTQRSYMNLPLHVRTVLGTAALPVMLREPLFFPDTQQIACYIKKISGGASTGRIFMDGTQFATWSTDLSNNQGAKNEIFDVIRAWRERSKYVWPYWYAPEINTGTNSASVVLTSGQTVAVETKISEIAHFEMFTLCVVSTGNFALKISEVKTKRTIMNGMITRNNCIGTNTFPTLLPTPYLLEAGTRLRWEFTDLSLAGNTIWIVAHGRRIQGPLGKVPQILHDTAVPTPADSESLFVPQPMNGMR